MKISRIYNGIVNAYLRKFNPVKWARKIGVKVGDNTELGDSTAFSSEPYLITIGNHCQITRNVTFHTHGGGNVIRRYIPDFDCFGKIIIEDWVYIGSNAIILPGVTIGEGSIIATASVVTKSIPPRVVAAGNPAKVICSIDDYIQRNKKYNTHSKGMGYADKKKLLENISDDKLIKK